MYIMTRLYLFLGSKVFNIWKYVNVRLKKKKQYDQPTDEGEKITLLKHNTHSQLGRVGDLLAN